MSLVLSQAELDAITLALSPARLGTYIQAATNAGSTDPLYPIKLYGWNAQVSGAFLTPLQICEVTVRNGICDAIELRYGTNWPWVTAFETSLPNPSYGFSPQRELIDTRKKFGPGATGKVVAELKMAFWSQMLTKRHDGRRVGKAAQIAQPDRTSRANHFLRLDGLLHLHPEFGVLAL